MRRDSLKGIAMVLVWLAAAAVNAESPRHTAPDPADNPGSALMLQLPETGADPHGIDFDSLPRVAGRHEIVSQGDESWKFRLHSYLTHYDGKYWCMWSHGPRVEDFPTQHVRYAISGDGLTWSRPKVLVGPSEQAGFRYIARGFWQREGELYALASHDESGGYFGAGLELRAFRWSSSSDEWTEAGVVADDAINNFPPKRLSSGDWIMSRRGDKYASDPTDRSWLRGGVQAIDDWRNTDIPVAANNARLEEPNVYELPSGALVSLYRDNSGSKRLYRAFSTDDGDSWSQPVPTNFPDATSKFCDLRTSRGYYVLVSNANPKRRNPLCLAVSQDGLVYAALAALPIPASAEETLQYPHMIEHDEQLLIVFSRNKTAIEVVSVPLAEVDALLHSIGN